MSTWLYKEDIILLINKIDKDYKDIESIYNELDNIYHYKRY